MLLTVLQAIRFEPAQAHTRARNAIFHWFEEQGAFRRTEQDGELRFEVDGRCVRPLIYPASFSAQPKFGLELLS